MKLNELTRDYQFDPEVLHTAQSTVLYDRDFELKVRMSALGWNQIGEPSSFSNVYANDSKPYILKVNRQPDRAFAWFAFLTRKFPNVHFPRIGNMKVMFLGPSARKCYIYLIEKLEEIPTRHSQDWKYDTYLFSGYIATNEKVDILKKCKTDAVKEQSFVDALTILKHHKKNFRVDLHNENLMQRKDGTIVIIDPFAPS